ncbi:MAG TPA: hypothetical protein VGG40_11770 [Solirubrobacterales bacterium]
MMCFASYRRRRPHPRREYCERSVPVSYIQYDALGHVPTAVPWITAAIP